MLRVVFTIVLPLILPTVVYLVWIRFAHGPAPGETLRWTAMPWVWLAAIGALFLVVVLFVVTVGFGTAQKGVYVPPRWQDGRIVPGHIEPAPQQ